MIVIEKDEGKKIDYEVEGTRITFNDDLSINLAKREKDYEVHIDVCFSEDRELVVDSKSGVYYVAQIDIPARRYKEEKQTEKGEEKVALVPVPLDMDTVTLTLWSVEKYFG